MLLNLTENYFFISTRSVLWPRICRKCACGYGFALNPTGRAHDTLPNSLVGRERIPFPNPHPTKEKNGIYRFCIRILPRICTKCVCPGPHWGSSQRSPDPLVGWGGDTLPRLHPTRRLLGLLHVHIISGDATNGCRQTERHIGVAGHCNEKL